MNFSCFKVSEFCEQEEDAINIYLLDMDSFLLIEKNTDLGCRAV